MSFGWSAMTWSAIGTAVTAASAVDQNDKARKAGNRALKASEQAAAEADRANNKANAKAPDSAAAMASAMLSGKTGQSGTMLTGPGGVDPTQLTLGRNTLLGGG